MSHWIGAESDAAVSSPLPEGEVGGEADGRGFTDYPGEGVNPLPDLRSDLPLGGR